MRVFAVVLLAASLIACGEANDERDIIPVDPGDDPPAATPSALAWRPATEGTLAGDTPSAEGSCPAGTMLVAVTTLPSGLAGEMDVCRIRGGHDVDVITLTNDNIYKTTAIGGHQGARATDEAQVTLIIEPGTLVLGTEPETLILAGGADAEETFEVPGFDVRARGTDANPVVITSQARFDAWIAGSEPTSTSGE